MAKRVTWLLVCLAVLASVVVAAPGCRGCRAQQDEQTQAEEKAKEEAKKRERPKPDFEFLRMATQPSSGKLEVCACKPGHWTGALLAARANQFDFVGDLETMLLDEAGQPAPLPGVPYVLRESRTVALSKEQPKLLQACWFVPPQQDRLSLDCQLTASGGGRGVFAMQYPIQRMPSYQYHFVVLARSPESYGYLGGLDSIKLPWQEGGEEGGRNYYRLAVLEPERRVALPPAGLLWTTIAYVLWDDAEPQSLTADQQQAMLDWLHWGGQLILSGPNTLETLKNSFLAKYLPALSAGTRETKHADFDDLNRQFTLPVRGRKGRPLLPAAPWTVVRFQVQPGARLVPGTGGLLAERRVGLGRVVVSAFRLTGRELTGWQGFDNFFNACLLARPPRRYGMNREEQVRLAWADVRKHRLDARQTCQLRFFARDTGTDISQYGSDIELAGSEELDGPPREIALPAPGVAAWNDFSPVASEARSALLEAARVEIPSRGFVIWMTAFYLLALVPANWAVFRALDRVEWAWAAAPVIALGSTMLVIGLARLDIGFARSSTELAVIEIQSDYPRAHVARYCALYTSLSTTYRLESEDAGTFMQPFPRTPEYRYLPGEGPDTLTYRFGTDTLLRGFLVTSNTTGLVHSEQFLNLGGPIELIPVSGERLGVHNRTNLALEGVGVIHRTEAGLFRTAWIGQLGPEAARDLDWNTRFHGQPQDGWWAVERDADAVTSRRAAAGAFDVRKLIELAEDPSEMHPGDMRLVAWTDRPTPGLEVKPAAPQQRHVAVVLAHLRYGHAADPKPDVNSHEDLEAPKPVTATP